VSGSRAQKPLRFAGIEFEYKSGFRARKRFRTSSHVEGRDIVAYRYRNRVERCFNKLKHFRRFATRFDRRAIHFLAFIYLAAAMIWLR